MSLPGSGQLDVNSLDPNTHSRLDGIQHFRRQRVEDLFTQIRWNIEQFILAFDAKVKMRLALSAIATHTGSRRKTKDYSCRAECIKRVVDRRQTDRAVSGKSIVKGLGGRMRALPELFVDRQPLGCASETCGLDELTGLLDVIHRGKIVLTRLKRRCGIPSGHLPLS